MATSVLLVDDHVAFRRRARQLLELEGLEVRGEASTAVDAVDLAVALAPDVVLLDVHLPDGVAFEAVGAFAQPVIMMSTHDEAAYHRRALACGAEGFLTKDELGRDAIEALVDDERPGG